MTAPCLCKPPYPRGHEAQVPQTQPPPRQFATEAAITILRIDDLIRLEPQQEGGEDDD
jgi:hypothetical protein